MRYTWRRAGALATAVVTGLVTACGSTVQVAGPGGLTELGRSGSGLGLGSGDGKPPAPGETTGDQPAESLDSASSGPGSTPTGRADADGPAVGGTADAAAKAAAAKDAAGSAGRPIKIGYTMWDQAGFTALTGNSEVGGNSEANKDASKREMRALVKWANATGGIAGRKIAPPIPVKVKTTDVTDQSRMTAYCTKVTEDDKVEAFIDYAFFGSDESTSCFARHHVTLASLLVSTGGATLNRHRPYLVTTASSAERSAKAMVAGLRDAGYFKGAKVGIVLDDLPAAEHAYQSVIVPALKKIGVSPKEVFRVDATNSGNSSSQGSAAVLRFRSAGVTHVFWFANFLSQLAFTNNAESQNYYPRYGWGDYAAAAPDAAFYVSPSQNRNSLAVSSSEAYILDKDKQKTRSLTADIDRKEASPGMRRCFDIISKYSGVNYYQGNSGRSTQVVFYCEHFLVWADAARKAGRSYSPATWGDGLKALGKSYPPAFAHSTDFSQGRMDGSSTYRVGLYSSRDGCKCFVGQGGWRPF